MCLLAAAVLVSEMAMASTAQAAGIEITPFAGYSMGGEFNNTTTGKSLSFDETSSYGIMLDFKQMGDPRQPGSAWIELYLSRQQTKMKADQGLFFGTPSLDVDVEYYHLGGTYGQATGTFQPFVVGTLGATHMVPKRDGLDSETNLSLSLGGGMKFYLTEHVGIRLDARWFGTLFNGSGGIFCSNGACLVTVQGDVFSQVAVNAGVILAF